MNLRKFLRDERGNVESSLVIVPLTILFLMGMQVAISVHGRNVAKLQVQSDVSTRALTGDFSDDDRFIHIESSGDGQNLDLLVAKQSSSIVDLLPGFLSGASSGRVLEVEGIAIVENQR